MSGDALLSAFRTTRAETIALVEGLTDTTPTPTGCAKAPYAAPPTRALYHKAGPQPRHGPRRILANVPCRVLQLHSYSSNSSAAY
jgi:hypothetical protein